MMGPSRGYPFLIVCCLIGCVSTPQSPTGGPIPSPSIPAPTSAETPSWAFSITPGTASYRISRSADIEHFSDSVRSRKEVSTNVSHESISLNSARDTINFSVVVDTFSTTVPGAITSAQISQLPVQISGFLAADSLVIRTDSLAEKCSP